MKRFVIANWKVHSVEADTDEVERLTAQLTGLQEKGGNFDV